MAIIWGLLNASNSTIESNIALKYMGKIEDKINTMEVWREASKNKDGTIIGLLEMI